MYTIGLIGGIASGKSTVSAMLAEHGAAVLDADRAAHTLLNHRDVQHKLIDRWGPQVMGESGQLDRSAIAQQVFGESEEATTERHFLESVIHPLTRQTLEAKRHELLGQGQQTFVIDAPLLLEAGWDSTCDLIVLVDTPLEQRLQNAQRRGWSPEELLRREQNQLSLEEKRDRSDYVIRNNGSLAHTRQQVAKLWCELVEPELSKEKGE